MRDVYEGMRAVCAVLEELEPRTPEAPVLRLAERHLRLLAAMLAARPDVVPEPARGRGGPSRAGGGAEPGVAAPRLVAPEGGLHVRQ